MGWGWYAKGKPSPLTVRFEKDGVLYQGRPTLIEQDLIYLDTVIPVDPAHPRLWPRAACSPRQLVSVE